jgi:DNA-directed RNA polymerase specialized sigma24 family protein
MNDEFDPEAWRREFLYLILLAKAEGASEKELAEVLSVSTEKIRALLQEAKNLPG